MPIRILLVDDDQAFRTVLRRLLEKERGFNVVGEAGDGLEALEQIRVLSPDIILMDIAMPRLNGLEATRTIKTERPGSTVVILTQHQEPAYQRAAAQSGADAFLPKTTRLADLLTTIRQLTAGGPDEPIG
jgi:DNA-binding NarL/FixJ family response regulator